MKLKILQIIQRPQLRGAEVFASQLSNHLMDHGHEVKLLALFPGGENLPFKGEAINLNRPERIRAFDLQGWRALAKIVGQFQPDIVQANAGDTLKYAVLSRQLFFWKSKIVFRNASTMSLYMRSPIARNINRLLLRNVDLVVSVSQATRLDIVRLFPFLERKTKVIPIGVEPSVFGEHSQKQEFSVIHIGGFSFEKNHKGLLRIMTPVLRQHRSLKLLLVGDGPLRPEVEALVKDIPERERIQILGFRSDAIQLLSTSKLLILPSQIEGLPGVILEAMACKVAVVAYNVGGISEVITHRKTGWLVDKGNEEQFTTSVLDALRDESQDILDSAYDNVRQNFQNTVIARKFIEAYIELTQRNT